MNQKLQFSLLFCRYMFAYEEKKMSLGLYWSTQTWYNFGKELAGSAPGQPHQQL